MVLGQSKGNLDLLAPWVDCGDHLLFDHVADVDGLDIMRGCGAAILKSSVDHLKRFAEDLAERLDQISGLPGHGRRISEQEGIGSTRESSSQIESRDHGLTFWPELPPTQRRIECIVGEATHQM